jgi:hypothetical protein
MRTSLLLALLLVIGCAKNMPPTNHRDSVLAQPSPERVAEDIPGESPDAMLQLEALIERDLYKMGLPSLREEEISAGVISDKYDNQSSKDPSVGAGANGAAHPDAATAPKPAEATVPPAPNQEPSKTPSPKLYHPAPTAPAATVGKKATKNRDKAQDDDQESSCQKTCALIDNICDAAARICQITEKLPKDSDAPQRCTRAQNACTRAQSQGASCPCSS